jgi:hypothetical protein
MNLEDIIDYLKDIENQNIKLKKKIIENENIILKLNDDLTNLSKVSLISNMDKQLKDKMAYIVIIERQLQKANNLNNELQFIIDDNNKYEKLVIKDQNYLIDGDNNIYDILNGKANKIVAKMKNNKVKFIKHIESLDLIK